jgi:GDP-L-fucose synthase
MNVLVTGARGFLGSHVVDSLRRRGVNTRGLGRQDGDLRDLDVAEYKLYEADTIIHLAADVGGVGYLKASAGRAFHDNLRLGLNVIRAASRGHCKRLILAGTPCAYSGDAELPLREEWLEKGVPSGDTGSYGYAKLVCSLVARDVCAMHGKETVTVIPSNLYGPRDAFDKERGHVVAALVRKALVAAERGDETFDVWGDGTATRDFVYVTDVADGIADIALSGKRFAGESYNLASGRETSIREIAEAIAQAVDPGISPRFQADKPVGYKRRVMSIENAATAFGYRSPTSLAQGILHTIEWLREDREKIARWVAEDAPTPHRHATATA